MPSTYVKAYVIRGKTDAANMEAICEAVMRPTTRIVATEAREQQAVLSLHRTRDLLVKQRAQLVNMIGGLHGRVRHRPGVRDPPRAQARAPDVQRRCAGDAKRLSAPFIWRNAAGCLCRR